MTFRDALFWLFALAAVLPALGILFSASIVRMAFLLMGSLAGFAALYLHLGAGFVGFTQVVVYIGGILILFLFGVMLTARVDLPVRRALSAWAIAPAAVAGALAAAALVVIALKTPWPQGQGAIVSPETPEIGRKLLSTYVLPFEAVSVLLLVAMIGATYLARAGRGQARAGRGESGESASVPESPGLPEDAGKHPERRGPGGPEAKERG